MKRLRKIRRFLVWLTVFVLSVLSSGVTVHADLAVPLSPRQPTPAPPPLPKPYNFLGIPGDAIVVLVGLIIIGGAAYAIYLMATKKE